MLVHEKPNTLYYSECHLFYTLNYNIFNFFIYLIFFFYFFGFYLYIKNI